tara:strand:- start:49 stop:615 length:567 start_codon:yes stop_codon:yes gene_type:complete
MKTVIDAVNELDMDIWKNAPEGATHYDVSPDVYPWIKEDDNGNKFWYHNEWVNYIHPISERDCHTRRPQPTPIFTQEMVDNGVLPGVGMECQTSTGILTIKYVGQKVVVSEDSEGMEFMTSMKSALHSFKPLTPPMTLNDGECYQFNSPSGGLFKGYYIPTKGLFVAHRGNFDAHLCTNIQPLTVEVK